MIPPERSENPAAAEFFMTLLHAGTSGHILHLQTRSYAQHKALDDFYSSIVDQADALIEAYQGKYGLVLDYPSGYAAPTSEPVQFLSDLSEYITFNRPSVGSDSELQNLIDGVMELIDSTIYKLRFLA